jgi:hypothetical protein
MKFGALVLTAVFCGAALFAEGTPENIAKVELPSLLAIYKDIPKGAPSSPVARNSATACLLVE